jgi:hypothetical protein
MPKEKKRVPDAVLAVIEETAKKVAAQMYAERNLRPDNCYKQTIKRIKLLPILQERVEDNRARLGEDGNLMPGKSKSIVRFSASGVRADPEEMLEAVRRTTEAHLAADQMEIDTVTTAMESVSSDYYYKTVYDGLVLHKSDAQLAEELFCDESTIRRNRSRLIRIISVRLYGVEAI